MKILLLAEGLETSSLSEPALWLSDLIARGVRHGHRVQMLCTAPLEPWQEPEDPPGVTVWRPPRDAFEEVLGEALALDPDVVHVASAGPFGARVVEILRELPLLLDVHDFWPICPNSDLMRRPRLAPCGEHYPFQGCGSCAGLSRLRAMEERVELARGARMVLAHSVFSRVRLNAGLGRPIEVLDYGVDTTRFRGNPAPARSPEVASLFSTRERPRVLFLGPPTHARGADSVLDLMVATLARCPETEFVVAGRDPGNPDWHQVFLTEAREMGLTGRAYALPSIEARDLPALYAACQVAIAPAIAPEAGGLFLLHAMAAGLPIVASPVGTIQDLVHDGEEGLLIPPHDTAAFANAVSELLMDPMSRIALGQVGRQTAIEKHDFERSAFALDEIYERLRGGTKQRAAA